MKTQLTGGAGYIGSHTAIELLGKGHEVVIFDNFSNSHPEAIRRVEKITGRTIAVINGDVRNQAALEQALREHGIDSVVHLAGKKAVGESSAQPVDYYQRNPCFTAGDAKSGDTQACLQLFRHRLRDTPISAL